MKNPIYPLSTLLALVSSSAVYAVEVQPNCPKAKVEKSQAQTIAFFQGEPGQGGMIGYNSQVMDSKGIKEKAADFIVNGHECQHANGSKDETQADVEGKKRMGSKYTKEMEEEVCQSLQNEKGDAQHPPGDQRCQKLKESPPKVS